MNSLKSEGIREGEIKGEIRGEIRGRMERNIEVARNSLKQNLSIDTISAITGLSINQINSLR